MPRTQPEIIADGIFRDLQTKNFTLRLLNGKEYRFALDAENHCDVSVDGDYAETLFDYGDLLDFCVEFCAKKTYRTLMASLRDEGYAELVHAGTLYTFEYIDACNMVEVDASGKTIAIFTHRAEFLDYLHDLYEITEGE